MSMATGGSSVGSLPVGQHSVYDLTVERDVIALLRAIHVSTQPLDIKNYLRDLIFMLRFGERQEVDQAFLATFKTHGFTVTAGAVGAPVAQAAPAYGAASGAEVSTSAQSVVHTGAAHTTQTARSFGITRQAPTFTLPAVVQAPAPAPTPAAPVSADPVPAEIVATPTPLPAPEEPVAVVPPLPQPTPEPVHGEPTPAPAPMPTAAPAPVLTPSEVPSAANPSERIAEIKREVNALVGNPVNLIDVNNEVGREYMNALLDAMKKSLGATPAHEVERAMARLERSFVSVKETLAGGSSLAAPALKQVPSVPEPAAAPEPVETTESLPVTHETLEPEPVAAVSPAHGLVSVAEAIPEPQQEQELVAPEAPAPTPEIVTTPVTPIEPAAAAPISAPAPVEVTNEVITPVAKEKQLRELMEARKAAEAVAARQRAEAAQHNPLMADDVNAGLKQLLSEWKLFKSSGIFGTGPSGDEHPLYKKLAPLTMAAVLAGRFEGATPDVKRSIADYMNGWRYEEGVTHEQGETFEIYLRRVIRHILDKHKAAA